MRSLTIILAAMFLMGGASHAKNDHSVDLSFMPEAEWHKYVGKRVELHGNLVRFGKFGPAISNGKGYLYIIGRRPTPSESQDNEPAVIFAPLHYQPPIPMRDRRDPRPGFFYILDRECVGGSLKHAGEAHGARSRGSSSFEYPCVAINTSNSR